MGSHCTRGIPLFDDMDGYRYVGDRNGKYVAVQRLVYAGPGGGDYVRPQQGKKEEQGKGRCSRCGACVFCLVLLLVCCGFGVLAWTSLQTGGRAEAPGGTALLALPLVNDYNVSLEVVEGLVVNTTTALRNAFLGG